MLLLSALVAISQLVSSSPFHEQPCVSKYGWEGYCRPSWECVALGSLVAQGYQPELCGTNQPIACCPLQVQPQPHNNLLALPQLAYPQTFTPNYGYYPTVAPPLSKLPKKKKRYPGAYLKTYIQDEDDNTIIRITPIRPSLPRVKRKQGRSPYRNIKKSFQQASYPADLIIQDDQLSLSYEKPQSSSAKMCQEYEALAWENISQLSPINGIIPISQEFCPGDKKETAVLEGELPFMVSLGYEDARGSIVWACSGTLVSKEYVLTAAHCLHPPLGRPKVVRLGTPHLRGRGLDVGVSEVLLHPAYNPSDRAANIALLKLAPVPTLGIKIRPACLEANSSGVLLSPYWSKDPAGTLKLRAEEDEVRLFPDPDALTLNKALTVEVDIQQCNVSSDDNYICVRPVKNESCESMTEGGEPLIQTDQYKQCHYTLIGVAVDRSCSQLDPVPFTSVAPYISWIENVVWP